MVAFFSHMNQLTSFGLSMSRKCIPTKMISIFANMPHLVHIRLEGIEALDKVPADFPECLQFLELAAQVIKQDPMPILEKLPCLVTLRLQGYGGHTMSSSARGFPRLQDLVLRKFFFLEEWRMEEGTMPKLCKLGLTECTSIRKLPEGLLQIPSLRDVRLEHMYKKISANDDTYKKLLRKGCEVRTYIRSLKKYYLL
jgi:hypothetical protein